MKTTAEMIEVMAAFQRGEDIECRAIGLLCSEWILCKQPFWSWDHCDYRIKPKPAKPKYTESDIPLCAIIRNKDLPQDVIEKACAALVRYANDEHHKLHQGYNRTTLKNTDLSGVFAWQDSDEGDLFWRVISKAPDRPDPYAEAKQAFADGVLQFYGSVANGWHDWVDENPPSWKAYTSSMFRRKPEPTGKWVEYPVTIDERDCHVFIFHGRDWCVNVAGSMKNYGGTKYEGNDEWFYFTFPVDERGVMLAPVAVRFWVEA